MPTEKASLRGIPSVERILKALGEQPLPRPVVVALVRRELDRIRRSGEVPETGELLKSLETALDELRLDRIRPVINGAGVLVHTNLGRVPLAPAALEMLARTGGQYSNLEFSLAGGERGRRGAYVEHLLELLCSAEAATVVNNCAAALVLILRHFTARRKEVLISRGELIQIGGGFRIPEILEAGGARLKEVGATNQTALEDYRNAVSPETALILKVHRSNFYMEGFVESPATEDLVQLAREQALPLVEDLGSGAVFPTEEAAPIAHERTPSEALRQGVDLVCFSGDKLFGGPQAGIIAGKAGQIAALKKEPFFRALRCDKLILGALQATAELHLQAEESGFTGPARTIPLLDMLTVSTDELRRRAVAILEELGALPAEMRLGDGECETGGGTLPRSKIPSITLELRPHRLSLEDLAERMRRGTPPVVGYTSGGRYKLDLRTVFPGQDRDLAQALRAALGSDL